MRMYNPEWEAIKDLDYTPQAIDAQFDLIGAEIPLDHGDILYRELVRHLPWLEGLAGAGVHPIHGAPSGRNANMVINRRVKLVLRLPPEQLESARALCGQSLELGAGTIRVGDLKTRPLTPYATLYSHFVVTGEDDEAAFLAAAQRELDALDVKAGMIPGMRRTMRVSGREVSGYSLMLHDVELIQSMRIQERGLGLYRSHGCGLFIPHKSIKEVVAH